MKMVKSKGPSKKQQKHNIDFKKIKRKVGRKLPPPKNSTNTEIKSKAIILPEQSIASEKAGLAVSKKGLTLKELLRQTSHHNSKVRKDALIGIRDIFLRHPMELRLHKLAVIEKLRERISDDEKLIRETLYQLLKSVVFPGCKEDNQGPFISLMMAYIFNAMTHLAIDVRLMAFKFFDLCVQFYPSSFLLYAEKILQNYEDILWKNQFYLHDKSKLKSVLAGLARCLSLLPCNKREDDLSYENEVADQGMLHAFEPDEPKDSYDFIVTIKKLKELLPVLVNCFQDFIPLVLSVPHQDAQSIDCMLSILHSIDFTVKYFVHGISKVQKELQVTLSTHERPDVVRWDQIILPSLKKLWDVFPLKPMLHLSNKDDDRYFVLNIIITKIFLHLSDSICPPISLLEKFLEFIESSLSEKMSSVTRSGKVSKERHLLSLVPFIPKLILRLNGDWKSRILQAVTELFKCCNPESSLKFACLSAVEEMLIPQQGFFYLDSSDPEMLEYQITWLRELPQLLIQLGDKSPSCSKGALNLLLRLGQCSFSNSPLSQEYDNMQHLLGEFYGSFSDEGTVFNGPFLRLPRDVQELSVCCLYYFSFLDPLLLQSLASSCLSPDLEPVLLLRILEVLHSAYKAGHIRVADYISFLVTLVSHFKVIPEHVNTSSRTDEKSNCVTLRSLTNVVSSCLSQIGDNRLVFHLLEKVLLDQISLKPPVDNVCSLLRILFKLDSAHNRLSEQSIIKLSIVLPGYLIDVASSIPHDDKGSSDLGNTSRNHYYFLPCFFLFYRSVKLLNLVLIKMGSLVAEKASILLSCNSSPYKMDRTSEISAIVSFLLLIHEDVKIQQILLSNKVEVDRILQNLCKLQSSDEINITIEERHKIKCAVDQLKDATSALFSASLRK